MIYIQTVYSHAQIEESSTCKPYSKLTSNMHVNQQGICIMRNPNLHRNNRIYFYIVRH